MEYNQELPKEVKERAHAYIERIKKIKWFKPSPDLKKEDVDKMVNASLEAFGVEAGIEYRRLKTKDDYDVLRSPNLRNFVQTAYDNLRQTGYDAIGDTANDAVRDAAKYEVWDYANHIARFHVFGITWRSGLEVACHAARHAISDAVSAASETLVCDLPGYKGNKAFLSLIPLWEAGLYPVGVVNGEFVVHVPYNEESRLEF